MTHEDDLNMSAASTQDLRDSLEAIDREIRCLQGMAEAAIKRLWPKRLAMAQELHRRLARPIGLDQVGYIRNHN
jgi:hypothetical protein